MAASRSRPSNAAWVVAQGPRVEICQMYILGSHFSVQLPLRCSRIYVLSLHLGAITGVRYHILCFVGSLDSQSANKSKERKKASTHVYSPLSPLSIMLTYLLPSGHAEISSSCPRCVAIRQSIDSAPQLDHDQDGYHQVALAAPQPQSAQSVHCFHSSHSDSALIETSTELLVIVTPGFSTTALWPCEVRPITTVAGQPENSNHRWGGGSLSNDSCKRKPSSRHWTPTHQSWVQTFILLND